MKSSLIPILLLASLGASAQAQPAPAAPTPPSAPTAPAVPAGHFGKMADRRVAELEGRLGVTVAQRPRWDDFVATMRANAAAVDALGDGKTDLEAETALQSMRRYAAFTRVNAENVQRLLPKFEALYDALNPAQRRKADELFAEQRRRLMRHAPG